ncbi:MAG: putative metal-binding motif-containing protein [Myxococcota bacterium]
MQWVVLMWGGAHAVTPATGATGDTGMPVVDTGLLVDADDDGFTVGDGDCDDTDADINPGRTEVCEDRIDNDCDGLFDEECDYRIRMASLRGAGGCSDNTGAALLVLLPLGWFRRSRRGGDR